MSMSIFPDGIVLDHVAEYVYGDETAIRDLYERDSAAYVDALARFLQTLVTHKKVQLGRGEPKTEAAGLLREKLELHDRIEFVDGLDPQERKWRRESIWPDFRDHYWQKICRSLERDRWSLVEGLCGHARREAIYFFDLSEDENWSSSHYVPSREALSLPGAVRRRLFSAAQSSLRLAGAEVPRASIEEFVDRTFTTYYLIFFEHFEYSESQYLPGYTRGNLPFLWEANPARQVFNFVAGCYAADMLSRCNERDYCLEYALDWCDSKIGRRVQAELGDIEVALRTSSLDERQAWADNVSNALSAGRVQEGVSHKVLRGAAHAFGAAAAASVQPVAGLGIGLAGLRSSGSKPMIGDDFRWVLDIPTKDRTHVAQKTRILLE